ncbi:MAG: hypothetical protein WKF59_10565 [Chitinophagaceae bacterium]
MKHLYGKYRPTPNTKLLIVTYNILQKSDYKKIYDERYASFNNGQEKNLH